MMAVTTTLCASRTVLQETCGSCLTYNIHMYTVFSADGGRITKTDTARDTTHEDYMVEKEKYISLCICIYLSICI